MQDQEDRRKLPVISGLPVDVKQYPLEHGWLLVSTVGMCFIPFPQKTVEEIKPLIQKATKR